MEKQIKVLITGATGKSGGAAIDELLKMGYPVRAMVHSIDKRSEELVAKGVEVVQGDLLKLDDISAAMKGVDTAYLCYPILVPGVLQANRLLDNYLRDEKLLEEGLPSVGYLASALQMSPRYLSSSLKIETGKTAQELIHIALIAVAKNRLRESGQNVSEIAYSLGFENMSYFSKLFKKEAGKTPKDFKKQFSN